jgi:hypothetical protein
MQTDPNQLLFRLGVQTLYRAVAQGTKSIANINTTLQQQRSRYVFWGYQVRISAELLPIL